MKLMKILLSGIMGLVFLHLKVHAQAADVPIENHEPLSKNEAFINQAETLRADEKLINHEQVEALLQKPRPRKIELEKRDASKLAGREIAALARKSMVRVGWYFHDKDSEDWQLELCGGYAIAKDVVVTCHHCVKADDIEVGYLIAVNSDEKVLPIRSIIAANEAMDVVILHVSDADLHPLAIDEQSAPGDAVFCFSDPLNINGYFSAGIINRYYWKPERQGAAGTVQELESLRMNTSNDWAPGSSGAALLNEFGRVVGHVSTISNLTNETEEEDSDKADEHQSYMTLHEAIPARSIQALIESAH
jgi:hypothetical protein